MMAVTITYIFGKPNIALGRFIPMYIAYIIGASLAGIGFIVYFTYLLKMRVLSKNTYTVENKQ